MTPMDNSRKSINHSSFKKDVSANANENVNSISNTHKAAIARNNTRDRITKRRIIKAMYALFF
jgi:hypothetical protein